MEACLLSHPRITDAAVIRRCREDGVEVPAAYVVLDKSYSSPAVSPEQVQLYVKEHLASYKSLDGGVTISVGEIPRSASGKILRRLLQD